MTPPALHPEWSHPRIKDADVIAQWWSGWWPEMAHEANQALWRRKDGYPALVAAGAMSAEEADQEIAAWQAIASDWDWICTGLGQPGSEETLPARIKALDKALQNYFLVFDSSPAPLTPEVEIQGAALVAMRWWAEREAKQPFTRQARWLASVGHQARARKLAKTTEERIAA
jgi:hypothetical protein